MKTYRGRRDAGKVDVTVDGEALDPRLDLRDLRANGFEWGYEGSGPSQLALAILADHAGPQAALGSYRDFTRTIVAEIEGDEWTLTSADIDQRVDEIAIVPMDLKTLLRKVRGEID